MTKFIDHEGEEVNVFGLSGIVTRVAAGEYFIGQLKIFIIFRLGKVNVDHSLLCYNLFNTKALSFYALE